MQGNLEQGISKLDKIGTGKYPLYFKAQALRSLGKTENAIQLLDSIRFLPIQNINNSLIVKHLGSEKILFFSPPPTFCLPG